MPSLNKVCLIGHLGQDPDVKALANGTTVANMSVATSDGWKDKATGEWQEKTEWHKIVTFGKLSDFVSKYLHKGSLVYVEGSLQTNSYEDKTGEVKYYTNIKAWVVKSLDRRPAAGVSNESRPASNNDEQIPF